MECLPCLVVHRAKLGHRAIDGASPRRFNVDEYPLTHLSASSCASPHSTSAAAVVAKAPFTCVAFMDGSGNAWPFVELATTSAVTRSHAQALPSLVMNSLRASSAGPAPLRRASNEPEREDRGPDDQSVARCELSALILIE